MVLNRLLEPGMLVWVLFFVSMGLYHPLLTRLYLFVSALMLLPIF
jgi:hypothetical protein